MWVFCDDTRVKKGEWTQCDLIRRTYSSNSNLAENELVSVDVDLLKEYLWYNYLFVECDTITHFSISVTSV